MTNTVFIDRALIVIPVSSGEIPDEYYALEMTRNGTIVPGFNLNEPKLPPHVVNSVQGSGTDQVILTTDPNLEASGLPPYPPLPSNYDTQKIEETRRTILMLNVDSSVTNDELITLFTPAGEVKYLRTCSQESDSNASHMLIEFTEQASIISALKMNGMEFKGKPIEIQHATQPIVKPQAKSNEAAQKEIEEAMIRFKEAQNMINASIEPVIGVEGDDLVRGHGLGDHVLAEEGHLPDRDDQSPEIADVDQSRILEDGHPQDREGQVRGAQNQDDHVQSHHEEVATGLRTVRREPNREIETRNPGTDQGTANVPETGTRNQGTDPSPRKRLKKRRLVILRKKEAKESSVDDKKRSKSRDKDRKRDKKSDKRDKDKKDRDRRSRSRSSRSHSKVPRNYDEEEKGFDAVKDKDKSKEKEPEPPSEKGSPEKSDNMDISNSP
ncbi:hypothetical protein NQ318_001090 [Aromia moschata]|uniref:RRM domain-containing protein n=1 Tax=Aromia moschata TaxID=1265417 RepID=A0AAV8ZEW4_9CUCU|nr:hypothetical protein NQ318_001090 [Aromia moschata]